MSNMAANRSFTPMVNAENVEKRLKDVVYRHWKDIQKTCRAADTDNSGQIPYDAFKSKSCLLFLVEIVIDNQEYCTLNIYMV